MVWKPRIFSHWRGNIEQIHLLTIFATGSICGQQWIFVSEIRFRLCKLTTNILYVNAFLKCVCRYFHCYGANISLFHPLWNHFYLAGNPYTAAEALLLLLESPPEPLASPMEEECLYAENFDKCCEIIKVLSGPKKNTFLYICMFLNELLKNGSQNRLDAVKLGEFWKSVETVKVPHEIG